jgi:hypothetical protein
LDSTTPPLLIPLCRWPSPSLKSSPRAASTLESCPWPVPTSRWFGQDEATPVLHYGYSTHVAATTKGSWPTGGCGRRHAPTDPTRRLHPRRRPHLQWCLGDLPNLVGFGWSFLVGASLGGGASRCCWLDAPELLIWRYEPITSRLGAWSRWERRKRLECGWCPIFGHPNFWSCLILHHLNCVPEN